MTTTAPFTLDAKYTQTEGTILLSGVQALVRLPLDQIRADRARGLDTAGLISGYRGSPLAGLDLLLQRAQKLLDEHQVRFAPGVNEDLGATMIWGSQLANLFPAPKHDGVIGMWYGKAPGVDRSGDIFKHASAAGVGRHGGVLAVAGDDPLSRSSTLPSASETAMYDALMPVLAPGNVQEVLDFGRLGFELSRFSGLWVGLKLVNLVADQFATAEVGAVRLPIVIPELELRGQPWRHTQTHTLGSPGSLALEQEIHEGRLVAARAFAAANRLNRLRVAAPGARLGLIAAGKPYYELREALGRLGLDDAALARCGVRVLQIGMVFPLDEAAVREFAAGLEEIIVVEEKRAFLELFVRDALYHMPERPRVLGKQDEQGRPLLPPHGELDADALTTLLAPRLRAYLSRQQIDLQNDLQIVSQQPQPRRELPALTLTPGAARTPYFCSGCPHNRSTVVPAGSIAAGGIGCHGLVHGMGRSTIGLGHMGGEGAQWAGAAPFSGTPHIFQNLGDGTLFHSGSLAIRQAVAAGANLTYKILYNDAVGMTGGQEVDGAMDVPALTRALEAEGVSRIIVTSEDPHRYPAGARWAPGVRVWHRDRLDEAQAILRDTPGVTALIHDQLCAAERRRLRKRGLLPDPATRVFISEAVCEGCGDCGVKSNCLSVQPVATEFGRKTRIHQSSCNKDDSCLLGDCPALLTVEPGAAGPPKPLLRLDGDIAEPTRPETAQPWNVYMMGIGGTGVVTVSQVLGTAALLAGLQVDGMDQTGLSQKGGAVVSHLKLSAAPILGSNRVGPGEADCFLAFDLLTATAPQHLARASAERSAAVISTSQVPTGAMVASAALRFPQTDALLAAIGARTRPDATVVLDAQALAERFFGDHLAANMVALGAAYQAGQLPVGAAAIEQAIRLNGAAVEMNTNAFRLGRTLVADPAWLERQNQPAAQESSAESTLTDEARALVDWVGAEGELRRLLERRIPELIGYQSAAYARQYAAFVAETRAAETRAALGETALSEAVARHLFKLMAYKDEYEVARLLLRDDLARAVEAEFGAGARPTYHLHPPVLRALGVKRKIRLGAWFRPALQLLVSMRRLRGTPLDPFGYAALRRTERALVSEYRALIEAELAALTPERHRRAVELAELPDMVRGYEEVKLEGVRRFRERAAALRGEGGAA